MDVRSFAEYTGETNGGGGGPGGLRRGRIPTALWGRGGSSATQLEDYRNPDLTMRSGVEILRMWDELGIDYRYKHLIFYCANGWRSAEVMYYAELMGLYRISLYDGGWLDWSSNTANPIETIDPSYIPPTTASLSSPPTSSKPSSPNTTLGNPTVNYFPNNNIPLYPDQPTTSATYSVNATAATTQIQVILIDTINPKPPSVFPPGFFSSNKPNPSPSPSSNVYPPTVPNRPAKQTTNRTHSLNNANNQLNRSAASPLRHRHCSSALVLVLGFLFRAAF